MPLTDGMDKEKKLKEYSKQMDRVPDIYEQRPDLRNMSYEAPGEDPMTRAKRKLRDGLYQQQEDTKRKQGKMY